MLSTYHLPWIFPDEAVVLNYKGFQSPPEPIFKSADYPKYPLGESGAVHERWGDDARLQALQFVANNHSKDKILRGLVPSTNTVNRRNSKKPLYRSPEYMSGSALCGGVVTTREGQALLSDKLKQRIQSLNDLDASAWGSPTKEVSSVLAPPSGLETQALDDAFVELADAVQSGYINSALIDSLRKANTSIIQIGPYLDPNQIADYIRINDSLQNSVLALKETSASAGPTGISGETKRLLTSVTQGLKRQRKLLEELNKKAYYSVADKQLLLSNAQSKLLPTEISDIRKTPTTVFGLQTTATAPVGDVGERSRIAREYLAKIRAPPKAVSRESKSS